MKFLVIMISALMLSSTVFAKGEKPKALKFLIENSSELVLIDSKAENKEMPSLAHLLSDVLTSTPIEVNEACSYVGKTSVEECKVSIRLYNLSLKFAYNFEFKRLNGRPILKDTYGAKNEVLFSVTEKN